MKKNTVNTKIQQENYFKKKNRQFYDYNAQENSLKANPFKNTSGHDTRMKRDNRVDDPFVKPQNDTINKKVASYFKKEYLKKGRIARPKKGKVLKPKKKRRPADDPYPQAKVNKIALEMLEEYETNNLPLEKMCANYYEQYNDNLKSKDRPQIYKTVFYVLRWRERLDYLIGQIIGVDNFLRLDLTLRNIYRLAAYNIMFMHRSVEEAIMLADFILPQYYATYREGMEEFIKGFAEKYKKVSYPDPFTELPRLLSVRYSLPEWIVRRWIDRYGEFDTRALLGYHDSDKPHVIRVNRLKSGVERIKIFLEQTGYSVTRHPLMKYGLIVAGEKKIYTKDPYKNGEFILMDDPQQIVVEWLAPKNDEVIIDSCAGSGEKSISLAGMMGNTGKIISVEFDPFLIEKFRETLSRTETTNIEIVSPQNVAEYLSHSEHPQADKILVDAPNSQLGNLIRHPETKWFLTPEQLLELQKEQITHLGFYAQFVKPGGELIYSVTSIEPEETDAVIDAFLKEHPQFEIVSDHDLIYQEYLNERGCLRILPFRHRLCALFACKFRRNS